MFRIAPLVLLTLPLAGASISFVSTYSEGGKPATCIGVGSCSTSSTVGLSTGTASAFIFSAWNALIGADVDIWAGCGYHSTCLSQSGSARAEIDVTVYGAAGTKGIIEYSSYASDWDHRDTFASVSGLGAYIGPGQHGGGLYEFVYGAVIHLSVYAANGCSECEGSNYWGGYPNPVRAVAFIRPFYFYDTDRNPISAAYGSPVSAPEPSSLRLGALGFAAMAWFCRRRIKSLDEFLGSVIRS